MGKVRGRWEGKRERKERKKEGWMEGRKEGMEEDREGGRERMAKEDERKRKQRRRIKKGDGEGIGPREGRGWGGGVRLNKRAWMLSAVRGTSLAIGFKRPPAGFRPDRMALKEAAPGSSLSREDLVACHSRSFTPLPLASLPPPTAKEHTPHPRCISL